MEQFIHSAWSMIPFGLLLLIIAIAPLIVAEWWDSNKHKLAVAILIAIPTAICMVMGGMAHELQHQLMGDYLPFIILLLALYVITGGIHLSGDIQAKPWVNTLFLAIGWALASFMGTTGAAMLLIRPLLATNQQREHKGGHFDDGLVVSCDDESGFFNKTDDFHDLTSILIVFSSFCSSDGKRIPPEYEKILRDRLKQH